MQSFLKLQSTNHDHNTSSPPHSQARAAYQLRRADMGKAEGVGARSTLQTTRGVQLGGTVCGGCGDATLLRAALHAHVNAATCLNLTIGGPARWLVQAVQDMCIHKMADKLYTRLQQVTGLLYDSLPAWPAVRWPACLYKAACAMPPGPGLHSRSPPPPYAHAFPPLRSVTHT